MADESVNPSVIYANYLNNGNPAAFEDNLINWLQTGNITQIIVGHQPCGDAPLLLKEQNLTVCTLPYRPLSIIRLL